MAAGPHDQIDDAGLRLVRKELEQAGPHDRRDDADNRPDPVLGSLDLGDAEVRDDPALFHLHRHGS